MIRVGIVVPALPGGGGVSAVARFLCRALEDSPRYEPRLVSLAMSSRDKASLRLLSPESWRRGIEVREGTWESRNYVHVGSLAAEVEFFRYLPRRALGKALEGVRLVQVVAGTPCWAVPVSHLGVPMVLQVATLTRWDRASRLALANGLPGLWRRGMSKITERFDRAGLRSADRVLVENRRMKKEVEAITGESRVVLAPPGVDTDRFRPAHKGEGGRPQEYILSVARFGDARKNPGLLFEAYARLKERRSSCPPLWLAGLSPPPESAWAIARERGVEEHIRYLGKVSEEELARLYRQATFFVLSSDQEGFGLVVVEAMASGIPVVSTASGGPEEIITHGEDGFLVPVGDTPSLVDAMEELVNAPHLQEVMGQRAREVVLGRYSLEAAGEHFLAVYDTLLGAANGRGAGHPSGETSQRYEGPRSG